MIAMVISMVIALTIVALIISTFQLASTKVRSSATANDLARLVGGYQFRIGAIDTNYVNSTMASDLGSLATECTPVYAIGKPESKVTITCHVSLLSVVPIVIVSTSLIWN